jgi:hypothetical protein
MSKDSVAYATDMIVKLLIGVCTILLGLAQNQLEKMSADISRLTLAVAEVSKDASLATHAIKAMDRRLSQNETTDSLEHKELAITLRKLRESIDEARQKTGLGPTRL